MPEFLSIGPPLDGFSAELASLPVAHAAIDTPIPLGIVADTSTGYPGRPGLRGARPDGSAWAPRFILRDVERPDATSAVFHLDDEIAELGLTIELSVDDVLTTGVTLRNTGSTPYGLLQLAPAVPIPAHAGELMTFTGRWCREFQPSRTAFEAATTIENRTGRTSHEHLPAVYAGEPGFGEHDGEVWGVRNRNSCGLSDRYTLPARPARLHGH